MQKNERSFLEDQDECVEKLIKLAQVVHIRPKNKTLATRFPTGKHKTQSML